MILRQGRGATNPTGLDIVSDQLQGTNSYESSVTHRSPPHALIFSCSKKANPT